VSAYERRHARAIGEGWTGYGQKRRARDLGFDTPAQYRLAKSRAQSERRAVEPTFHRPARVTRDGVIVRPLGGRAVAIAGKGRQSEAIWREMRRFTSTGRRAEIYVRQIAIGRGHGFTLEYLRERVAELGSFRDFLEAHAAGERGAGEGPTRYRDSNPAALAALFDDGGDFDSADVAVTLS